MSKTMKDPKISDRGFAQFEPVRDTSGQLSVQVTESSAADEPKVWLRIEEEPSLISPGGVDVSAHLSLESVELVHAQLGWMLENHYHKGGR